MKRYLALVLALVLALGCMSTGAIAEDAEKNVLRVITHRTWADHMYGVSRAGSTGYIYWGNSLLHYDYSEDFGLELAESYEWAEDGETIIFHLRDGVYFSDGTKMTSEDVVFTYQMHIDNQTAFNNNVWAFCDKVEAIDELTVAFHMYTISPRLWDMFFSACPIICKAGYEADPEGYSALPYGTGGWKLTYADPTTYEMRFERWDDSWVWDGYFPASSNIDEIIVTQNSEESSRVAALRAGEVDAIESVSVESIATLEGEGFYVNKEAAVNYNMLGFNCREERATNDINLRKAISYAIDRQAIVDALLGGANYVYTWPCRDTFMGFQDTNIYEYSPEKAKEYLAQSTYNGEALELIVCVSYVINASECAQAIGAYLQAVGINVNINVLEGVKFNELEFAGEYDINFIDLSSSVGENAKFVWEIFGHDQFSTGYPDAISTNLREIADMMDATVDPDEQLALRTALYAEMAEQYAPYVFLWGDATYNATTTAVSNVDWQPTIMSQYYEYASKN